ncbi:hypothetical protein, partial [Streptomyces galilaeus]|uniref:hypothetical protein n=1 Tax=Streptomyces galilaeus TaxID=33899 RepID=UPI001E331E52
GYEDVTAIEGSAFACPRETYTLLLGAHVIEDIVEIEIKIDSTQIAASFPPLLCNSSPLPSTCKHIDSNYQANPT